MDINEGFRVNSRQCPVARAITRATGQNANVGVGMMYLGTNEEYKKYLLPACVDKWTNRFDQNGTGSPFEFELDLDHA